MNTTQKNSILEVGHLHRANQRGFTLVEMLVVVLVIGLLTGIVGPRLMGQLSKSEVTVARAQLASLDKALATYRIDMGSFPSTEQGLQALLVAPEGSTRWRGPYLQGQLPKDPWGTPYVYSSPGVDKEFDLRSLGSDKRVGGTGDAADIVAP